MLRPLLFYISVVPLTIYHSIRCLMTDFKRDGLAALERSPLNWARQLVNHAGLKVEVDTSTIDPEGQYVFIGNHQSYMDIPVLFNALRGNHVRFAAKKSLFDIPIYGKALAHAGNIVIDRENPRAAMKSIKEAVEHTQKLGISPLIFPEGTRNAHIEDLMEFKTGAMILALKCGLPVVPFVMVNTGRVLPTGKFWIHNKHTIKLKTLPIVDPSKYTIKERDKFRDDLREMMRKEYLEMMKEA